MYRILLLAVTLLWSTWIKSTHIVGGEVLYKYIGNNKYEVTLHLFIDCVNGSPLAISQDTIANFTVFTAADSALQLSLCQGVKHNGPQRITKLNYDCIALPPNACVDKYTYTTIMELPPVPGGYFIAFQRCCRNHSINNLVDPGGTGATYWTLIQDTVSNGINNSAYFKELPPNFLCTNAPLVFDHSAIDPDGDSLVYELYHPFHGATASDPRPDFSDVSNPPFQKVNFANGYSAYIPIDGNPRLHIDSVTGLLTLTPTQQGQYVIGILVKEYRNGVLVGITRRDYQFNVLNCQFKVVSSYQATDSICDLKVKFSNNSSGAKTFSWNFGDSATDADTSSLQSPEYVYPNPGKYNVKMIACDGNCCDSSFVTVTVVEPPTVQLGPDTSFCSSFEYELDASLPKAKFLWSTGDTLPKIKATRPGSYWVKITRCQSVYDTVNISIRDFSDFTIPNSFSPNSDGANDFYPMMDSRVDEFSVIIYNRWGEKMFESKNNNDMWDGTFKHDQLPPGVYFFLIRYKDCRNPDKKEIHGTVTLFR